jgi:hypothetical protein
MVNRSTTILCEKCNKREVGYAEEDRPTEIGKMGHDLRINQLIAEMQEVRRVETPELA